MSVDCVRWIQVKQRLGVLPLATVTYSELHAAALHAAVIAGRNTTGALAMVVRIKTLGLREFLMKTDRLPRQALELLFQNRT